MDGYYFGRGFAVSLTNGCIRCAIRSATGESADLTGSADVTSLTRVNDGTFHHVAVERNGTNLYVFLDGVIAGKSSSTAVLNLPEAPYTVTNQIPVLNDAGIQVMWDDGTPVYAYEMDQITDPVSCLAGAGRIGQVFITPNLYAIDKLDAFEAAIPLSRLTRPFVGTLDEIQIYNRALTAYEIYSITHSGVGLAFIDQPLNQRGLAGRPIILHSLVVGVDPITYQWQFNGLDIPVVCTTNKQPVASTPSCRRLIRGFAIRCW